MLSYLPDTSRSVSTIIGYGMLSVPSSEWYVKVLKDDLSYYRCLQNQIEQWQRDAKIAQATQAISLEGVPASAAAEEKWWHPHFISCKNKY